MLENRKKIQNLLENVIRASQILMEKGYLDAEDGKTKIHALLGIRQRFLSDDYMGKTPKGFDIDEIDEMILSLDRMLVEAGKRGYQNTIVYILRAVIQGAGVGHRILTEEEEKSRALVLLQRKLKVRDLVKEVQEAWKLDEKISSRKFTLKRQEMLRKDCKNYETKIEQLKQSRPDIMEEILYFSDVEDVSTDAFEYIELSSALEKAKKNIAQNEDDLEKLEYLISSYMEVLNLAKRWDISLHTKKTEDSSLQMKKGQEQAENSQTENSQMKHTQTDSVVVSVENRDSVSGNSVSEDSNSEDLNSEEKIQEMQKLIEKFIDEDGPSMVDLGYQAMERAFASPELKAYAANSLQEFEDLGLIMED